MLKNIMYNGTLRGIIEATNKFITGEWDSKTFSEYGETFKIRAYIPILEKATLIAMVLNKYLFEDIMAEFAVAELQKEIFYYVLLQGYALIDCGEEELITYENYDLLYPIFYPFITSYCKNDYDQLKEMLEQSISLFNINNILESLKNIDINSLKVAAQNNTKVFNALKEDKELIDKLNNIAILNDPMTAKVTEEIKKMALEKQNIQKENN